VPRQGPSEETGSGACEIEVGPAAHAVELEVQPFCCAKLKAASACCLEAYPWYTAKRHPTVALCTISLYMVAVNPVKTGSSAHVPIVEHTDGVSAEHNIHILLPRSRASFLEGFDVGFGDSQGGIRGLGPT
jgi:hypothetical protein